MHRRAAIISILALVAVLATSASPRVTWAQGSPPPPPSPSAAQASASASGQISRPYPESVSIVLEDAGRVATLLTVLAGGIWVYFNFLRGRTYRPRLELEISGTIRHTPAGSVLAATIRVRNVGLSRVGIKPEGTACTVSSPKQSLSVENPTVVTDWANLHVSRILSDHRWIEPSETIAEQQLVVLPLHSHPPCQVAARVVATQGTEWNASVVVLPELPERTVSPRNGGEHAD